MILTICYAMWLGICSSYMYREYDTEASCVAAEERLYTREVKPAMSSCSKKIEQKTK